MNLFSLQLYYCIGLLTAIIVRRTGAACVTNALYQSLTDGCHATELRGLCSSYLSGTSIAAETVVITKSIISTTYLSPKHTMTSKRTVVAVTTTDILTFTKTLTYTQAATTVTTPGCKPTITCGAVTITNSFGPLTEACSCLSVTTTTSTEYFTSNNVQPVVYLTTKTIYKSNTDFTVSTTRHPIVTTRVPTLTVYDCSSVAPPATTCNNSGFQLAKFQNENPEHPKSVNFQSYKTATPQFENPSIEDSSGYFRYTYDYYLDGYTYCQDQYVNLRGYIYAPQTGYYNWTIAAVGDVAWTWIDNVAYSGYNRANIFLTASDKLDGGGPSKLVYWEAGTYHAFRFAWHCYDSNPYDFFYHMRRPDGRILFGLYQPGIGLEADTPYSGYQDYTYLDYGRYIAYYGDRAIAPVITSDYIVHFGCGDDAKLAPQYPPWGQET